MFEKFKENANEILWHTINALLLAALVFIGALTGGQITRETIVAALAGAAALFLVKIREYWDSEEKDYVRPKAVFDFL